MDETATAQKTRTGTEQKQTMMTIHSSAMH
jgi:hypothetical protein